MLISQMDAQAQCWYKTGSETLSFHSLHRIIRLIPSIMVMKKLEMYAKVHDCQRRFNRACDQILLLNTRLHGLRKRYKSARSSNCKTFRFPLRMRMMVAEGLVKRYYHYADMKRSEIIENKRWTDENRQFWRRRSLHRRQNLNHVHCVA